MVLLVGLLPILSACGGQIVNQRVGTAFEPATSNRDSAPPSAPHIKGMEVPFVGASLMTSGATSIDTMLLSNFPGKQSNAGASSASGPSAAGLSVEVASISKSEAMTQLSTNDPLVGIPESTVNLGKRRRGGNSSPTLASLTCAQRSVTGAGTESCTVTLTAATASGLVVSLSSNDLAVVLPASVTVTAGATEASFQAAISAVGTTQTATVTASAAGVSASFALQLNAAAAILSPSSSSLSFGSVNVNTPTTQSVTLTSTGNAAVTVNSVTVTGSGFTVSGATFPLTLNPNQTAVLNVRFDPAAAGTAIGTLTIASNSSTGSSSVISLSGSGVPVLTALHCANGSMTGAGTDSCTVTLNAAAVAGGLAIGLASNNSAVSVPATVTVPAGASTAGFTATVSSVSSAQTVTLTASAGGVSATFGLSLGACAPVLTINASAVSFGDVNVGTTATQSITLTSTGAAAVTVKSASIAGSGFGDSGLTFPLTLNPNQTATLNVLFDPTGAASVTGTLTIVSTSLTNPTATISLSGTGMAVGYAVDLSWNAPASSPDPVAGYIVYRSPSGASSYVQMNSSAVTQTAYTDPSVKAGQAYDYVIESIDASGVESAPSNVASATIP